MPKKKLKQSVKTLEDYQEIACEMVERDENLLKLFAGMDTMAHLDYELPESLRRLEWVRKFVSSSPYDALRAAVRALSNFDPRIKIEPVTVLGGLPEGTLADSRKAREKANEWEQALKWQFSLSEGRQGILLSDVIRSAIQYDAICGQIVYLPEQIKNVEAMGGNLQRYKAACRYGDFTIILHNPKNVHVRYSRYMTEAVLLATIVEPQEIVDFWGKAADKVAAKLKDDDGPEKYVLYDYSDYDSRCVWCVPGDNIERAKGYTEQAGREAIVLLEPTKNKYPFLPWVCMRGGTNLDESPEFQHNPLLFPVWKAQQWTITNIVGTLTASEAIAEAAKPKLVIEGPGGDNVEVDYTVPGGRIDTGMNKVIPLPQTGLDPAKKELLDRLDKVMNDSTVARILVTADTAPGESYSGYNLRINTAVGSLMPFKRLSERWLAECYRAMLYWIHYCGKTMTGYGRDSKRKGMIYKIESEDIDPENIYLSAELIPDVPTDRLQKVNAAIQMSRELRYPVVKILEELGETNPEGALKDWAKEQMWFAAIQGKLQLVQAQASNQIEQMAAQMAQQMMQQQMEQMQQSQSQTPPPQFGQPTQQGMEGMPPEMAGMMGGAPPDLMGGQGMPGVEGQGFNPGAGGMPAAMANPAGNVREQQTGVTALGQETM